MSRSRKVKKGLEDDAVSDDGEGEQPDRNDDADVDDAGGIDALRRRIHEKDAGVDGPLGFDDIRNEIKESSNENPMGEPVGISTIFLNNFMNTASGDVEARIVGLKNILTITQPFSGVEIPAKPNWKSALEQAKQRLPFDYVQGEAFQEQEAVKSGLAYRIFYESYEDALRSAVMLSMKALVEKGLLSWNDLMGGGQVGLIPNRGFSAFKMMGRRS